MANNSRNSLNTYAAVGAVGAAAAGAMLYKRTHTTCGQCGCKITGRQYTIRAYNEESKAAIVMAGANPHAKYCSDCYASLKSEFDSYRSRIDNYDSVRTFSINYRGNTYTDDSNGVSYTTDSYDNRNVAEKVIRKVAAVYGCDAVTNLSFDRDDDGKWTASGTICDFR